MRSLNHLSGEKLLLVRIFGDDKVKVAVECELDRRALLGPKPQPTLKRWVVPDPRYAA